MERTRRDALRLAGLSVATAAAGCLGGADRSFTGGLPEGMDRVDEPPQEIDACSNASDGSVEMFAQRYSGSRLVSG